MSPYFACPNSDEHKQLIGTALQQCKASLDARIVHNAGFRKFEEHMSLCAEFAEYVGNLTQELLVQSQTGKTGPLLTELLGQEDKQGS